MHIGDVMKQLMSYKLHYKLITAFIILAASMMIFTSPQVSAKEITPSADSYSYGSTSEYSASTSIEAPNSTPSGNLASTGDPANIIKICAIVLILVGVGFGARAVLKKRKA